MLIRVSPSNYVVRMSGGKVVSASQGTSFWAWPWETHIQFPATLQWMLFSCSQVTRENQGVDVKGAFSWRVTDPMVAYRSLNMEPVTPEEVRELMGARSCELERCATADQGPLMRTTLLIRQLAESVTRNAVANMHLEETIRDRRTIIERLKSQIDAVVAPWGVEVSSIEIVDIRIASKEVFSQMQARFREQLRQEAKGLQIAADEEIRQHQLASASRVNRIEHDHALAGVALHTELSSRELAAREEVETRRQGVEAALALEKSRTDAERNLQETMAETRRQRAALEAELERRQQQHVQKLQHRREYLEVMARKNEIMGQVNEAYRSQRMIEMLPRLVEGMKAEKTTVFANSLPGASLEGLASSLLSMAEVAGFQFKRPNGS